ncbi:MAG TPA: hypothetical protein VIT41_00500 [Microlunatus sp.]
MGIGELAEGPLHAELKQRLSGPGGRFEVPVGRWVIDLVRADGELVEIQTGGFGPLGRKLDGLLDQHRMRIVRPVPGRRWVVRTDGAGEELSRRRSPRAGRPTEVFDVLVAFPTLIGHPNLVIEVLLCEEEHVRAAAPVARGRRRRDPGVRHLVGILESHEIRQPEDVLDLLGTPLPAEAFTTAELGSLVGVPTVLAQRITFCLRLLELIQPAGKRGRAPLYRTCR